VEESRLEKELAELQEFTRYEKELRDASILEHQEVMCQSGWSCVIVISSTLDYCSPSDLCIDLF